MLSTILTGLIFALICLVLWHLIRFVVEYAQASRAWADLLGVLLVLIWALWLLDKLGIITLPEGTPPIRPPAK
jgi:hypothetical protein